MENWVNLEGKFVHLVADMSKYTAWTSYTENVSVCTLGIFGTKYVRSETLQSAITLTVGDTSTITVPKITSQYSIGNTLDIKLR